MASVGTPYILTDASQAMRGCGLLMPLLDKANAPDNAVRQFADTFEPPSVALLEFGPHHLAGSITDPLVAPRLSYLLHLAPPPSRFFVVADEKRSAEDQPCRTKNLTEKT